MLQGFDQESKALEGSKEFLGESPIAALVPGVPAVLAVLAIQIIIAVLIVTVILAGLAVLAVVAVPVFLVVLVVTVVLAVLAVRMVTVVLVQHTLQLYALRGLRPKTQTQLFGGSDQGRAPATAA